MKELYENDIVMLKNELIKLSNKLDNVVRINNRNNREINGIQIIGDIINSNVIICKDGKLDLNEWGKIN